MATPSLRPMTAEDREAVERLWQLYSHDMSEVRGTVPDARGLFRAGRLPGYFDDPDRSGHVISDGSSYAGFAFVTGLSGDVRSMGDFFVVRSMRRTGVGFAVASQLLVEHPGRWEIGFQGENGGAPEFWRRVVGDLVGSAGSGWQEQLRPVPGKPHIPHDHFLVFEVAGN